MIRPSGLPLIRTPRPSDQPPARPTTHLQCGLEKLRPMRGPPLCSPRRGQVHNDLIIATRYKSYDLLFYVPALPPAMGQLLRSLPDRSHWGGSLIVGCARREWHIAPGSHGTGRTVGGAVPDRRVDVQSAG